MPKPSHLMARFGRAEGCCTLPPFTHESCSRRLRHRPGVRAVSEPAVPRGKIRVVLRSLR